MAAQAPSSTLIEGTPSPTTPRPFEHAEGLIEVLPDKIDVEEEARLYEELCDVSPCDMTDAFSPTERPADTRGLGG